MIKILRYSIFLFLLGCNKETELQKLCKQIRLAPQTAFPAGKDEKWKLIKELEKIEDKALPDSVKSIFSQIDTSIRGYSEYRYVLINLLAKPESRKSLKTLAVIFNENYIADPSCSQALSNCFFMNDGALVDLLASYIVKKDLTNNARLLTNVDIMFPELAHILGKRPFSDRPILDLLKVGVKAGVLDKTKLASSKSDLIRYYGYLKYVRDTLAKKPTEGYNYNGYYESHMPDLLIILKIFEPDEDVSRVLAEAEKEGKHSDF